jgi:hypothetical protein
MQEKMTSKALRLGDGADGKNFGTFIRATYLGKAALSKFVLRLRNVRIKGMTRKGCETCFLVHAHGVLTKRQS